MRVTKDPIERKKEIVEAAKRLFEKNGYKKTKVVEITREINVAKGTFYHYFESKEAVLEEIVKLALDEVLEIAKQLEDDDSLPGLEKIRVLLHSDRVIDDFTKDSTRYLEMPENRELQERTAVAIIDKLTPYIVSYLKQGVKEKKVTKTDYLQEKVEVIMSAAHFLIDSGLFPMSVKEINDRLLVLWLTFERLFGIKEGTFSNTFK